MPTNWAGFISVNSVISCVRQRDICTVPLVKIRTEEVANACRRKAIENHRLNKKQTPETIGKRPLTGDHSFWQSSASPGQSPGMSSLRKMYSSNCRNMRDEVKCASRDPCKTPKYVVSPRSALHNSFIIQDGPNKKYFNLLTILINKYGNISVSG